MCLICKSCQVSYDEEDPDGTTVQKDKATIMGYGSQHDLCVYKFDLEPGFYCYTCLDKLVDSKKCGIIKEWEDISEAFDYFYPQNPDKTFNTELMKKNWERYGNSSGDGEVHSGS